jgi:hypothetical protein
LVNTTGMINASLIATYQTDFYQPKIHSSAQVRKGSTMIKFAAGAFASALFLSFAPAAYATPITFFANLSGTNESPPNASAGTGVAKVVFDLATNTMSLDVTFSGLLGTVTASHIHCCTTVPLTGTAGVATTTPTFAGFPSGVTSGTYSNILDMSLSSSYNPAFVIANGGTVPSAELAFYNGMLAGKEYLNIHTTVFPAGEIRGFLQVPEPFTLSLFGAGLVCAAAARRRKKSRKNLGDQPSL